MFETVLIMATTTVVFLIGINIGYRLRKDEKVVIEPKIEETKKSTLTTKAYKEEKGHEQGAKKQEAIERLNKIMTNLERYDGTSNGQMEVK